MSRPTKADRWGALVDGQVARLMEHFDTVQIIATKHESAEGTHMISRGSGNFYARLGSLREWLDVQEPGHRPEEDEDG